MPPSGRNVQNTSDEGYSKTEVGLTLLKFIAILAVLLCLAANIVAMDNAVSHKWFDLCDSSCESMGGKETGGECGTCCQSGCSFRKKAFFYILRLYSMFFCLLSVVAMLPAQTGKCTFVWTWRYFRGIKGFVGRGLLQMFVGMQTVEANFFDDGSSSERFADAVGYMVVALGLLHVILGVACVKEEQPDLAPGEQELEEGSPAQQPPPGSAPGDPAPAPPGKKKAETAYESRQQRERREEDEAMERDRKAMNSGTYTNPSRGDDALAAGYYAPKPASPTPPPEPGAAAGGKPLPTVPPAQPSAGPPRKDVDGDVAARRAAEDDELERQYAARFN